MLAKYTLQNLGSANKRFTRRSSLSVKNLTINVAQVDKICPVKINLGDPNI